jgi:ribonucleoside-diphosphate reductase alpha chain
MIETIIKRDGRKEPFSPNKVNAWAEWATKNLGNKVDWSSVVLESMSYLPKTCTSKQLQDRLIKTCLERDTWSYNKMAGRLYAALMYKEVFNDNIPTVKALHKKLIKRGLMIDMGYTNEEYDFMESIIDHSLDLKAAYFELNHIIAKYAIVDRVNRKAYETQQFTYMRMAAHLASMSKPENKLTDLQAWYEMFSQKEINAPTPNYVNLGTPLKGLASCCLYTTLDSAPSLAVGDHIAYTMTYMSAGIGSHINTRSVGDPIRGGVIEHQGKLNYYRALVGAVKANLQNGRGGAATVYYNAYDPEAKVISHLKNPMSTEDKKIRGVDYNLGYNKSLARKAAKNEEAFAFNQFTAPELHDALYSDNSNFDEVYEKYENDKSFKKEYFSARELILTNLNEGLETGRAYLHDIGEINRHTPFKDVIHSSNLCAEIAVPTSGYPSMEYLYSKEDHGKGEIGLCSLGGINYPNIKDDARLEEVMYYCLLMIDRCIHITEYALPHLELTAKSRMNAGIGIMGLAHCMAREGLEYTSKEGKQYIHDLAERHAYFAIKASLRLGKELGNAPWMHKTKWPEGWLPIDTYNKEIDKVVDGTLHYDWEGLRSDIIANGGIRNSSLIAHMPGESSSKGSGTTNSIYPVRDLTLIKGDDTNRTYWAAPEGDKASVKYQFAWDVSINDLTDCYAAIMKFTDQAISADWFIDLSDDEASVSSSDLLKAFFYHVKMGIPTRYYFNSKTSKAKVEPESEEDCLSCKL